MSDTVQVPVHSGWEPMTGNVIGSNARDVREPGGSTLQLYLDNAPDGVTNPMTFDFVDINMPSLATSAYSTALLAQKKWATQGVGRIIAGDQISGTIECPAPVYEMVAGLIGAEGTARIEIPNQKRFSQWRVAILNVDGPTLVDGDRMTGNLVLAVTNTGPDHKSEVAPVFGELSDSPGGIT